MIKYKNEFIEALNKIVSDVDLSQKFEIEMFNNNDEFVIHKTENYNKNTDFRIVSSCPILFIGSTHCIFSNLQDCISFCNFNKVVTTNLIIKKININFNQSTLCIEFENFELIFFPKEFQGWLIFLEPWSWIECIEYGAIELNSLKGNKVSEVENNQKLLLFIPRINVAQERLSFEILSSLVTDFKTFVDDIDTIVESRSFRLAINKIESVLLNVKNENKLLSDIEQKFIAKLLDTIKSDLEKITN